MPVVELGTRKVVQEVSLVNLEANDIKSKLLFGKLVPFIAGRCALHTLRGLGLKERLCKIVPAAFIVLTNILSGCTEDQGVLERL